MHIKWAVCEDSTQLSMCSLQEQQFLHCREKFDGWVYNFTWIYNCLLCEQQSSILLYLTDHASSPQPSLPPLLIISLVKTVIIFFWTHTLMEPLASFTDHHPRYLLLAVRNLRIVLHYHWRCKLQQRRKYQQTPAFAVVHDQQHWCSSWWQNHCEYN